MIKPTNKHSCKMVKNNDQVIIKGKIQMPSKGIRKYSFHNKMKPIEFAKMIPLLTYQIGKDIKNIGICYWWPCGKTTAVVLCWSEVKGIQLCPTLWDPMDYTVHGILQARILEWVAFPSSRGIFPTQGSNPGLLHCRWILYQLSHQGSPKILGWVAYPFSRGSSRPRNTIPVSCIAGRFFTVWATGKSV